MTRTWILDLLLGKYLGMRQLCVVYSLPTIFSRCLKLVTPYFYYEHKFGDKGSFNTQK